MEDPNRRRMRGRQGVSDKSFRANWGIPVGNNAGSERFFKGFI